MFSRVSSRTGPAAHPVRHCLYVGLWLIACTSANVKSPAVAPAVTHGDGGKFDASGKTHWDFYDGVGTRTPVVLPLPKAGTWQIDDQSTPWWVATNSTLELKLEARLWPERRRVTPEECLSDLQRWRRGNLDLSQRANPVQSQTRAVPEGFDSRLTLSTSNLGGREAVFIVLVGADVSRCFAFLAEVEPAQPVSQDEIMTRAALITEAIIPKIRLRAIEQRIDPVAH